MKRIPRTSPKHYTTTYWPVPERTLETKRTWRERILDLRHATGLMAGELYALTRIDNIRHIERRSRLTYRPTVQTILAIRKMEAVFKEELVVYLHKPHGLLRYREYRHYRLLPFGGYCANLPGHGLLESRATVTFQGRAFRDIAEMDDVEAIRALKNVVTTYPIEPGTLNVGFAPARCARGYNRVIEAASRGHFMPVTEIARIVESYNPEGLG